MAWWYYLLSHQLRLFYHRLHGPLLLVKRVSVLPHDLPDIPPQRADVYIEGKIIVEAKTDFAQWLEGFFQALHYHKQSGLVYSVVIVITHKFIGIWRVNKLTEFAVKMAHLSDANLAPNTIGKLNAKKKIQPYRE